MTAIAAVSQTDPLQRRVEIHIGERHEGGGYTLLSDGGDTATYVGPDTGPVEPSEPVLRLTNEQAMALLQELNRFFDGGEDTRSLRRDYDAERRRVDALMVALVDNAAAAQMLGAR